MQKRPLSCASDLVGLDALMNVSSSVPDVSLKPNGTSH